MLQRLEWTSNHQCTSWGWSRWSHFGDEPKPHPPCPNIYIFFPPLFCPKTFLSYLPTSPLSPPPSYLQSLSLELERECRNGSDNTKVGARAPKLEREHQSRSRSESTKARASTSKLQCKLFYLLSTLFFVGVPWRRRWLAVVAFFSLFCYKKKKKKATLPSPSSSSSSSSYITEGVDTCRPLLFVLFCCSKKKKKATAASPPSFVFFGR